MSDATVRYALLETLLVEKGLALKAMYTMPDAALIFGTSRRTIQKWILDRKIQARDLPARAGRFLSLDLELFL